MTTLEEREGMIRELARQVGREQAEIMVALELGESDGDLVALPENITPEEYDKLDRVRVAAMYGLTPDEFDRQTEALRARADL